jgi:thioesterase domain-containing protein/acyl carrier protein
LKLLGPGVLINGYGPTENTTFTTCHAIDSDAAFTNGIPIGKPIHHTTVHVLDEQLRPVTIGEAGELYTGGNGVAIGYWNRDDLTHERFVDDPFSGRTNAKLYRTGDLVRWTPQGHIEFIGRADGQVKVRGFRIELGEIENALNDHPDVKDRVVIVRSDGNGEKQLVCYVVPRKTIGADDRGAVIEAVRGHLRDNLPEYMVPTTYVVLDAFPLNPNGKVDKHALPAPSHDQRASRNAAVAPRNRMERDLTTIWSEVLELPEVGVHDNFFDLGGHSLIGIQLLARIEERYGAKLPLKTLFRFPTVAELAAALGSDSPDHQWTNLSAIRPEGRDVPLFCVHGDEANHFIPRYLEKDRPFYGFFHQGEDGRPLRYTSVEEIAAHFITEMREARPHGPYLLCGYSFGGMVAYEMARQLRKAGEEVPFLGLFDTYAPEQHTAVVRTESKWYDGIKKNSLRTMIRSRFRNGGILPVKLRHFNIIDTYDRAIAAYKAGRYDGRITLFRAEGNDWSNDLGWSAHGDVEVVVVPGDHYTMIKEPAIATLVQRMTERLRTPVVKPISEPA